MTCPACITAATNPTTGMYGADCDECKSRAIANGHDLYQSAKDGYLTPEYRRALAAVFGPDGVNAGHLRVKDWAQRIKNHQKGNA